MDGSGADRLGELFGHPVRMSAVLDAGMEVSVVVGSTAGSGRGAVDSDKIRVA